MADKVEQTASYCMTFFHVIKLAVIIALFLPVGIYAQQDTNDVLIDPVIAHNKSIKHSNAILESVLPYPGKVYGIGAEGRSFILDIEPKEKFQVETKDFDSLLFFFTWLLSDNSPYEVNYYIGLAENEPFINRDLVFEAGLSQNGSLVNAKKLNSYKGKRLYDVVISDDVLPFRIQVNPLPESLPYIDVVQSADTNKFQVRLKRSSEIDGLIKQDMEKFKSQGYAEVPIGVVISDPEIPGHSKPIELRLRQKVKKGK